MKREAVCFLGLPVSPSGGCNSHSKVWTALLSLEILGSIFPHSRQLLLVAREPQLQPQPISVGHRQANFVHLPSSSPIHLGVHSPHPPFFPSFL